MKAPLLTIITPVYNGEKFMGSCLQSVIDQNCPYVEHLIMDGGSTDRTLEIVEQYAQWYQHIRVVSKSDGSQSSAMNKGIALARGKIIGFLNCDDYYERDVFYQVLKHFRHLSDPGFLVGNCNVLNDDEKIVYLNKPSRLSLINILIGGERNQFPFNPSSYFYHKSLHERAGLYDESDHYTMDLDFLLRAVKIAHIKYINATWGNFRLIKGTKTFESKENGSLEPNKMRLMNVHLARLSRAQRWWVKTIRFLFVERKFQYYGRRIVDCLKNPREVAFIMERRLRSHQVEESKKHYGKAAMTTQV
jgi:glycosyltransferase involved in cell wall biosynthesis